MSYHHLGADNQPPIQVSSEGAFREGARAMRDAIESKLARHWPGPAVDIARGESIPAYTPPPVEIAPAEWQWWSGSNEEWYANGPFAAREDAIDALDGEGGYIIEAQKAAVHFSAARLIDYQYIEDNDGFDYEHSEPDRVGGADVVAQADAELQALLNAWTDRWRHTFIAPNIFAVTRNGEYIPVDYTNDGPLNDEERAELDGLNALNDPMLYQLERRHYLRERDAFFMESTP